MNPSPDTQRAIITLAIKIRHSRQAFTAILGLYVSTSLSLSYSFILETSASPQHINIGYISIETLSDYKSCCHNTSATLSRYYTRDLQKP